MDPRPEAGPSRFTGIQPGPLAWKKNDEVQDLATRIGAVPTTGTLKMLDCIIPEVVTTDPRRRAPAYVLPYKRARLAEPVPDQDLDLDLVQVIRDFGEASWGGECMGPGDPDLDLDESVKILSLIKNDTNLFEQNAPWVICSRAC